MGSLSFLAFAQAPPAFLVNLRQWKVTAANGVNIRTDRSTSSQIIGQLKKDDTVEAFEKQVSWLQMARFSRVAAFVSCFALFAAFRKLLGFTWITELSCLLERSPSHLLLLISHATASGLFNSF